MRVSWFRLSASPTHDRPIEPVSIPSRDLPGFTSWGVRWWPPIAIIGLACLWVMLSARVAL